MENTTPITEIKMSCCGAMAHAIGVTQKVFESCAFETQEFDGKFEYGDVFGYYCVACGVDMTGEFLNSLPLEPCVIGYQKS